MDAFEEIAVKLDRLDLWKAAVPYCWALRPQGTVLPYFSVVVNGENPAVKTRLLFIEGWENFHEFVHVRRDRDFGFILSPMEVPHFEYVVLTDGSHALYRHDAGYLPRPAHASERDFCARMMREVFGVLMRLESEPRLVLQFSAEQAMFSRAEDRMGKWTDEPLKIPQMRQRQVNVRIAKEDVAKAKDLPFASEEHLEVDFRIVPNVMTKEERPRLVYALAAVDSSSGEKVIFDQVSVNPESGIKALWEGIPSRLLKHFLARGRIPGELCLRSGRLFMLLRPLIAEIPLKLSLHDKFSRFEERWLSK